MEKFPLTFFGDVARWWKCENEETILAHLCSPKCSCFSLGRTVLKDNKCVWEMEREWMSAVSTHTHKLGDLLLFAVADGKFKYGVLCYIGHIMAKPQRLGSVRVCRILSFSHRHCGVWLWYECFWITLYGSIIAHNKCSLGPVCG